MVYPAVTLIILNYNGLKDTKKCIKSVLSSHYPRLTIIVVDNGSKRNEALLLQKAFQREDIQFIRNKKNYGFTDGNNRILANVKTKYVVLLNNDVEVTPNWLKPLIVEMEKNKKIAVAQPKILWAKKKRYFDYAGACGGYIDMFGYPFTRGRIFNTIERDNGQYDEMTDIFWASGAAMVVRSSIFKKIGYFDTRFFNYMEEIDLCFRINKAGYRIVCIPKTHVYHKGAATSSKNELRKRFWEHRNNLLMITKNFAIIRLLFILPARFFLDYASFAYYLFNRRPDYAAAVLLSHLSYLHLVPQVLLDRLTSSPRQKKVELRYIFQQSIVMSYFIFRKRTYATLFR